MKASAAASEGSFWARAFYFHYYILGFDGKTVVGKKTLRNIVMESAHDDKVKHDILRS